MSKLVSAARMGQDTFCPVKFIAIRVVVLRITELDETPLLI